MGTNLLAGLARTGLLVAAAISIGVHVGLAPEHLDEWLPLGISFVLAAAAVSLAVAAFAVHPDDRRASSALALLLAGLVVAYLATRLAALPPLDPDREPFDLLGLATVAAEACGALLAVALLRSPLRTTPSQGGTR
jgi:hypothetical protein